MYNSPMQRHRSFSSPVSLQIASLLLVLCSAIAGTVPAHAEDSNGETTLLSRTQTQTFGWIEKVILSPELNWMLDAKLDTGADTSSLDAVNVKRVRYKGKSYVRFSIRNPETGELVSLRRPYVRTVRIRRHNGNHQRRRVVLMTVCLGNSERTIEVTLTDREYFDYPMLLGRSALAGLGVVDPMVMNTTQPSCQQHFGEKESDDVKEAAPSEGDTDNSDSSTKPIESSVFTGAQRLSISSAATRTRRPVAARSRGVGRVWG